MQVVATGQVVRFVLDRMGAVLLGAVVGNCAGENVRARVAGGGCPPGQPSIPSCADGELRSIGEAGQR